MLKRRKTGFVKKEAEVVNFLDKDRSEKLERLISHFSAQKHLDESLDPGQGAAIDGAGLVGFEGQRGD